MTTKITLNRKYKTKQAFAAKAIRLIKCVFTHITTQGTGCTDDNGVAYFNSKGHRDSIACLLPKTFKISRSTYGLISTDENCKYILRELLRVNGFNVNDDVSKMAREFFQELQDIHDGAFEPNKLQTPQTFSMDEFVTNMQALKTKYIDMKNDCAKRF